MLFKYNKNWNIRIIYKNTKNEIRINYIIT